MSYCILGRFDIEGQRFPSKDICFDILKILNERSYSVSFDDNFLPASSHETMEEDGSETYVNVYTKECFEGAIPVLEKKREKVKEHLAKLEEIRTSVGYYTMSSEAKDSFEGDIECTMEELDDTDYKLNAVRYVLNVMEFVSSLYDDKPVKLKLWAD